MNEYELLNALTLAHYDAMDVLRRAMENRVNDIALVDAASYARVMRSSIEYLERNAHLLAKCQDSISSEPRRSETHIAHTK